MGAARNILDRNPQRIMRDDSMPKAEPIRRPGLEGSGCQRQGSYDLAASDWGAVFELCLVGVMVIFELLGHREVEKAVQPAYAPGASAQVNQPAGAPAQKKVPVHRQRR